MHRNKLLRLLERYGRRYPDEPAPRRFRRFVERQPRCFDRDCWDDGHVTGSAAVLNADASAMLLTRHAKLGKWLQLGGHADGETDPLAVACREAGEESGLAVAPLSADAIDVDIHGIPRRGVEPAHLHYDVRFVLQAAPGPVVANHESTALRWVPWADVPTVTREESILRLAAKARASLRAPGARASRPQAAHGARALD